MKNQQPSLMVHTNPEFETSNLILDFKFDQHLESHKHVINIIIWFRDMGCYSASASLKARLRNPNPTHFQAKQAARSRRVSHDVFILLSFLWHNQQTIAHLILRHKSRNCRSDFVDQIIKPQLPVLRPKLRNPSE
jgi:hypothetical protein